MFPYVSLFLETSIYATYHQKTYKNLTKIAVSPPKFLGSKKNLWRRACASGSSGFSSWVFAWDGLDLRCQDGCSLSHEEKDLGVHFPWIESWLVKVPGIQTISMVLWILTPEYNNRVVVFHHPLFIISKKNRGPFFSLLTTCHQDF